MGRVQVGSCPTCGAPIYSPTVWVGLASPPAEYTCACAAGSGVSVISSGSNTTSWNPAVGGVEKIQALQLLKGMTDEERLELFAEFCTYCGCDNPRCQCWNDEW